MNELFLKLKGEVEKAKVDLLKGNSGKNAEPPETVSQVKTDTERNYKLFVNEAIGGSDTKGLVI
ncbi:MAG: hypothetical protein ACP5GW_06400, partial [Caldisericaceae bacterium]